MQIQLRRCLHTIATSVMHGQCDARPAVPLLRVVTRGEMADSLMPKKAENHYHFSMLVTDLNNLS